MKIQMQNIKCKQGLWQRFFAPSVMSPLMAVTVNLIIVFAIYSLARLEFFLENYSFFTQSIAQGTLYRLFAGGIVFDVPGIMYTNSLYILLMLLPLHLKETPRYYSFCKWVFIIVNSLALLVNLSDSVYFSYTLRRTTTDIFNEFSNEGNIAAIVGTEMLRHYYLVLLAIAIIWGMWRLYVSPAMNIRCQSLLKYYILSTLSLAIATVTCISGIRGGLLNHWYNYILALILAYIAWRLLRYSHTKQIKILSYSCAAIAVTFLVIAPVGGLTHRDIRPITLSNANAYASRPTEAALVLNTPFALIRTIGKSDFVDPHYFPDKSRLAQIYSPIFIRDTVTSPMKHRNVVILIVESLGREYIGSMSKEMISTDYKGYTPFVDSLAQHSLTFRYSFCNGRKSIDGMPSILASIPMFVKPFVLTSKALNHIEGIPAHLASKGWQTAFFHGARTGSMGFDGFAHSIGFQKYYGREDFNSDSRFSADKDFDGYWAIWDEPFLQFYALKMTEMKQPFMTAVFTASSHHPFQIPAKYNGKFPEGTLPIHKCIGYTDMALRHFFDTASRQPWYKNTIFILTSDHTNQSAYPVYKTDLGGFHSPIIIYDPGADIKPGYRNAIAQQIDIMPTILNYLKYDRNYIAFGNDLLTTPDADTRAINYINGIYQYIRYGYVLQFDGAKTIGLYRLTDKLMQHNLTGKAPEQSQMETEIKAIIQQYMDRMTTNTLTI